MRRNISGFAQILVVILFLVGFASLGLYYISTRQNTSPLSLPTQSPAVSSSPASGPTANWQTYKIETEPTLDLVNYQIKLPQGWWKIEHSSNFQKTEIFQDTHSPSNFTYKLTINQDKNINEKTGQPFTNLQSLTGFPYEVSTLIIADQQAIQVLPRAGSEMDYKILFFSKEAKLIFSIELDTPRDGSKVEEGKILFTQILSTFKFTN